MRRGSAATVGSDTDSELRSHGRAYTLGWYCFFAFVALTPLFMAVLPPRWGTPSGFLTYDPVSLPKTVAFLVLSCVSLGALCVSAVRGESELRWHPVLWVIVALIGWAGISTAVSASPAMSVWGAYARNEGLVSLVGYGLVAFLAVQYVRSTRNLRTLMVAAVLSGSLVSVYAVVQYFGFDPIEWTNVTGRVWSTFGNADTLGTYLLFPLALSLGLALSTPKGWRSLGWWLAAALIASALWLTETRGAWLGAGVMLLCLIFAGWYGVWRTSRRWRLAFGGLVVFVTAATGVAIALVRRGAANSTALSSQLARLSNGRTIIWLTGLRGWLAHPITGWGPDGFARAFERAVGADWYAAAGVGFGSGLAGAADNAHNFIIQILVTLGIPGLVLTTWAIVQTLIESFRSLRVAKGPGRLLLAAVWAALLGTGVSLLLGLTTPMVSVWLWLAVGLLLAPLSRPITRTVPRAVFVAVATLGLAVAAWAVSWLVADVAVSQATRQPAGPSQVSELQSAVRLDPLVNKYRWLVAEAIVSEALAEQSAGQSRQAVDETMQRAISAYDAAASADPGDALVHVALANILVSFAARHPGGDAAGRALGAALYAAKLAPRNAAVLVALATAYEAAGRHEEAQTTARLAREVAPAYSMQTLGSLGLDTTP